MSGRHDSVLGAAERTRVMLLMRALRRYVRESGDVPALRSGDERLDGAFEELAWHVNENAVSARLRS